MIPPHSSSVISTAVVAVIIFSTTFHVVLAQEAPSLSPFSSPEPSTPITPSPSTATNDCMASVLNMSDCLSYVQKPPTATVPDKNCCPELAGLVDSNPICLCQLLSNSSLTESYGIKIDVNRALKLPSVCKIKTPPVSMCSAVGYPVPGPMAGAIPESPSPVMSPMPSSEPLTPLTPSPSTATNDCMAPVLNMSDCLSYVQKPPTATVPDKNCCPELAGLVDSNPICLCQLLSNSSLTESYGIKIDVNRALKLPSVCKIKTPPVSMCSAVGYPVPGPMAGAIPESPSPVMSPMSSSASGVEAPVGLASSPTAGNSGNGAAKIGGSAKEFFIIGLAFSFLLTLF